MAVLTSPTCKHRAPLFGGQSPSNPWPRSAHTRRGGPFLTRVPVCAPIRGPARVSLSSIRMPVQGQHHNSRGSKTSTHQVWAARCMLPLLPLKIPHHHFHPFVGQSWRLRMSSKGSPELREERGGKRARADQWHSGPGLGAWSPCAPVLRVDFI